MLQYSILSGSLSENAKQLIMIDNQELDDASELGRNFFKGLKHVPLKNV